MTLHRVLQPEQVEIDLASGSESSDAPGSDLFNVTVSMPEQLEIRMVDASVLGDYEVWFFMSSILTNAVVGFGVSFVQSLSQSARPAWDLLAMTVVWAALLVVAVAVAFGKRAALGKKSRTVRLAPK